MFRVFDFIWSGALNQLAAEISLDLNRILIYVSYPGLSRKTSTSDKMQTI
ncbi:MAG: hypothetical protein QOE55_1974 [Acidobacteriaceae bacterium]|jgi:hypothetical protein|nr:hypothetical protein [Acidobacteriaceae bacterium]